EHDDHVALTGQPDRGLDRLAIAQAASHLERSRTVEREPERPPVELGLRHEAEPADGPARHPEGPWIEAREVVAGEDDAAGPRHVLGAARAQAVGPVKHRPADQSGKAIKERRIHAGRIAAAVVAIVTG